MKRNSAFPIAVVSRASLAGILALSSGACRQSIPGGGDVNPSASPSQPPAQAPASAPREPSKETLQPSETGTPTGATDVSSPDEVPAPAAPVADLCHYDPEKGKELARIARAGTRGNRTSRGKCWKFVDDAIEAYMRNHGKGEPAKYGVKWYTLSAAEWARSAVGKADAVKRGMMLRHAPEWKGKPPREAPFGSVFVFNPGRCGFDGRYGHAEVRTGTNEYSSDYIQNGRSCPPDFVFVPVTCP